MKCILNLKKLFEKLEGFKIALIKTDVPYMPSNFPKTYAVGKDLDIVVEKNKIDDLRIIFEDYSQDYRDDFNIICIDEPHGFRVRFQEGNKLHFQFDVKWSICGSETFSKSLLDDRILADGYYITDSVHELIVRLHCNAPHKPYHLKYIKDNLRFLNSDLVPDGIRVKTMNIMGDIICSTN